MAEVFDPYYRWLGIPPEEQPPNHYRLLSIELYELDRDVISNAADLRMAHIRTFQAGKHGPVAQEIRNQIAAARVCLLDPQKKQQYDQQLRQAVAGASVQPSAVEQVPRTMVGERHEKLRKLLAWVATAVVVLVGVGILVLGPTTYFGQRDQPLAGGGVGRAPLRLRAISPKTIDAGSELVVPVDLENAGSWNRKVQYTLAPEAPSGARIDRSTGVFTWTPQEAGSYKIVVKVASTGADRQLDQTTLTVRVQEVARLPVLADIEKQTVREGTELRVDVRLADVGVPGGKVLYRLVGDVPQGARLQQLDGENGLFVWTPTEEQGPGHYDIKIRAQGAGNLSGEGAFSVDVLEVNRPPVIQSAPSKEPIDVGHPWSLPVQASDPDLPANKLTFALVDPPSGARIDAESGMFAWTPAPDQAGRSHQVTVRVTDNAESVLEDEKTIKITVAATPRWELQRTLEGHTGAVHSVVFSPDGSTLASGSHDGTVKLWDPATGKLRHTLEGYLAESPGGRIVWEELGPVVSVAFSPDGSTLASAGEDGTVKLYDVASGEFQRALNSTVSITGYTFNVTCVAFSPDGSVLASGSSDNTVKLWDSRAPRGRPESAADTAERPQNISPPTIPVDTPGRRPQVVPTPEEIVLQTTDGVRIALSYYPGTKGKETVPVVLLHMFKRNRNDYAQLAAKLQSLGHAVLVPDLRGHGDSTTKRTLRGPLHAANMSSLEFANMVTYDMQALKAFLVQKNNAGELNIEKLCLVGAEMGASVALNWTYFDWTRRTESNRKQGQDVKALVLISPEWTTLGLPVRTALMGRSLTTVVFDPQLKNVFKNPGEINFGLPVTLDFRSEVSVYIVCGKGNPKAVSEARRLHKMLKRYHPDPPKQRGDERDLFFKTLDTTLQGTQMLGVRGLDLKRRIAVFINLRLVKRPFSWAVRNNPYGRLD